MSALAKRILGCLLFVLAIQIPVSFGFNKLKAGWLFSLGLTCLFFISVIILMLVLKKRGELDEAVVRHMLLLAVCLSLAFSIFNFNNPGIGAFAGSISITSLYGTRDLRWIRRARAWIKLCLCVMLIAGLQFFVFKTFTYSAITLSALGIVIGGLAGDAVGPLLNCCVPPLVRVWHELKAVGPVLGGYSMGYVLVSIVFAGCYASLNRLDGNAIRGLGVSSSFIDYWYYSVSVLTTIGSDANPVTAIAKIAVASEVFCGIAWTVIVFSVVLAAARGNKSN